ncbi:alpha/beta hydrolase [Arsenicibacter rosenii]|uniref:AB hydrolase-1 domain-containing protein n=1 Tax=Arsenicibacter rosenii TaxID=1750698 RepID=A0A1S2VGE5_9BACT|nr:alpha/beta hydrolase [Arsenicibacter rosenii]OIN57837.1 hypothetical protein BLX24_17210 [Arsenicibacter rosenii]
MVRIVFIPGYTEDPAIFDTLAPLLPAHQALRISNQEELSTGFTTKAPDVVRYAAYLAQKYAIRERDIVIGHSMGGWIGMHLKQQTGCKAILVGSFTDPKKVRMPYQQPFLLKILTYLGIIQGRRLNKTFKKLYPHDESRALYTYLLDRLPTFSRRYVWQQLKLIFSPVPALTVSPDIRIHARRDTVVKYPDEAYVQVAGDHFSVVFHAAEVAAPIQAFMQAVMPA